MGRVLNVRKAVNSTINSTAVTKAEQVIVQNEYDKLGQLKKKTLGANNLETLNYDYNIRGWMLGMNRDYARDVNSSNYFGFDLGYDKTSNNLINGQTYNNPQYNGNIEGMVWKSKGDGEKRKYDYVYDAANRLLKADFTQYTGSAFNQTAGINYDVKMGDGTTVSTAYDANGNIKQMQQWGLKIGGSSQIDNLTYTYQSGSNKLAKVTDTFSPPGGGAGGGLGDFHDGINGSSDDYSYDVNGNMNIDNNKAISSITYNYLNLPSLITVAGKGTITYTYDAAGNKLKKETAETGQPVKTTLYVGGAVYENDVLQFLGHEEGRIRYNATNNTLQYDYMVKDHLGNVRMVLTEEAQQNMYPAATLEAATITAESDYYGNLTNTQYTKPSWFGDPLYLTSTKVAQVKNASGNQKIGPNMILKVMAGDSYNIRVASGWSSGSAATNDNVNVAADLLTLLSTGAATLSGGKATPALLQNSNSKFSNQ